MTLIGSLPAIAVCPAALRQTLRTACTLPRSASERMRLRKPPALPRDGSCEPLDIDGGASSLAAPSNGTTLTRLESNRIQLPPLRPARNGRPRHPPSAAEKTQTPTLCNRQSVGKPDSRSSHRFASCDGWVPRGRRRTWRHALPRTVSNRMRSATSPEFARVGCCEPFDIDGPARRLPRRLLPCLTMSA